MRTQKHAPHKHGPEDYRWLANQCRQASRTVSTEKERTDLLARAKTWEFLAGHFQQYARNSMK